MLTKQKIKIRKSLCFMFYTIWKFKNHESKNKNMIKDIMSSAKMEKDELRKDDNEKSKIVLSAMCEVSEETYYDFSFNKGLNLDISTNLSNDFWNALSLEAKLALKEKRTIKTCLN